MGLIKDIALDLLERLKSQIINGDCDEDEIASTMAKFNPQVNGYVKEDDFVNYDEALKILGLSNNRAKLNKLCKKYNVKNVKFNNMSVGFPRKEIERIKSIIYC